MGNCISGNSIDISSGVASEWQGGYAYGNFNGCGWVQLANGLDPASGYANNCGSRTYAETYFANKVNVSPSDDGAPVPILNRGCETWGNVRPWVLGATGGNDKLGDLSGSQTQFFYRYLSKNNNWVLGRIQLGPDAQNQSKWGFVQRGCVGEPSLRDPSSVVPAP